jgi:hypothetical protein
MPDKRMPTVYVVEPQALFGPELAQLVAAAGGRVVGDAAVRELVHDLRIVFDGGTIWDRRAEVV